MESTSKQVEKNPDFVERASRRRFNAKYKPDAEIVRLEFSLETSESNEARRTLHWQSWYVRLSLLKNWHVSSEADKFMLNQINARINRDLLSSSR